MFRSEERPRLTVAIIVRNAAEALEETLASTADIADETVVLDTGSSDDTPQVARRHGAVLIERPWDDDFSAARNHCQEHACGDWILWLDAGETIEVDSAQALRRFLDEEAAPIKAYMLLVKVPRLHGNIAGEQIGAVRLVPNHPELKFTGRIRERLTESLYEHQIEVEALPWRILRGDYENEPQNKIRKARRNLQICDIEIAQRGQLPHLLNCQGEAFSTLGDHRRAAELHRQALAGADADSTDMLEAYYGILTALDGDSQSRQAQLSICLEALESYPLDAQLLCAMGGYLQNQGHNELAMRSYQTAWQYGQVNPEVWHLDCLAEISASCYSMTLQLAGNDDEAQRVIDETLEQHPDSLRLRRQLIELHVKHGRRDEALAQFDLLPADLPNREALRSAIRGACLAAARSFIPARSYLETAYQAGCRDLICLRWLVATLLAIGDNEAARPIIDQWRGIDPGSSEASEYLKAVESVPGQPPQPTRQLRVDTVAPQLPNHPPISSPTTVNPADKTLPSRSASCKLASGGGAIGNRQAIVCYESPNIATSCGISFPNARAR